MLRIINRFVAPGFFVIKKKKGVPAHGFKGTAMEVEIPVSLTDDLLRFAFEMQVPVEVIVEQAIISFLERKNDNG